MQIEVALGWIYAGGGFLLGAAFVGATVAALMTVSRNRLEAEYLQRLDEKEETIEALEDERGKCCGERQEERIANATLRTRVDGLGQMLMSAEERLESLGQALEEKEAAILALEKQRSELQTRLQEEREQSRARLAELKEAREAMQKEFKLLADRVLEDNRRRFGELSRSSVEEVLKPLRQQVTEFRERIDRVHTEETKEMATLMQEIRQLRELNHRISEDAVNLTRALRGESKTQGIWGEMVLERVLEASGLRKGEEYEREVSLRDTRGRRFRPDVVVHLPDHRDLIIDAKTSLVAYERYVNTDEEEERRRYARLHLDAVKRHIDRLAEKNYSELEGIETLDFVFMFLPIEGALMLALQEDPGLYDAAFLRHIVLVSPTTLLVALRAVENTWRRERQNHNAQEIARRAGALYDKFVSFAEELEKMGKQLDTVQKSYDMAWKKLIDGRGNIVRQVETLRELGAKTNKTLPKKLREEALDEEDKKE